MPKIGGYYIYRIDPNLTLSRAFSESVCVTSEPQGAVHEAQMCYWRLVVGEEASQVLTLLQFIETIMGFTIVTHSGNCRCK